MNILINTIVLRCVRKDNEFIRNRLVNDWPADGVTSKSACRKKDENSDAIMKIGTILY